MQWTTSWAVIAMTREERDENALENHKTIFEKQINARNSLAFFVIRRKIFRQMAQGMYVKCTDQAFLLSAVNVFGKDAWEPEAD